MHLLNSTLVLWFLLCSNFLCAGINYRPRKQPFFWLVMQSSTTVMGEHCQPVMAGRALRMPAWEKWKNKVV